MSDEDIQQIIARAFSTALSLSYTQTDAESKETRLFLLKSTAYYNLQAYLTVGLTLPPSVDRFASDYPKGDLKALTDLDSNIYDDMKNCFVNIFNHCHDFELKTMGKFVTVTAAILNFCDDAGKYIGGKGLLRDLVGVLSDDNLSGDDPVFKKSSKMAQAILSTLATRAKLREADCADLVGDLTQFLALTKNDKKAADDLYAKFISPGVDGKPPYSESLQATLAQLRLEAAQLKLDYQAHVDEYAHDVVVAATAVTYVAIWPFGTIAAGVVMGVYADRAIKAKEAYEREAGQLVTNEDSQKTITTCINHVTNICSEITNIEAVVTAALEALKGMQTLFGRLAGDFQGLADKFASMSSTLQADDAFIRALAAVDLDAAISQWAEIRILALDFMTNAPIDWKDVITN